jgi:hypothetical protein
MNTNSAITATGNDLDRRRVKQIIDGYADLIDQRIKAGFHPYLATFMFARLHGNRAAMIVQMRAEIERVYSTLLTRVVRRPLSPRSVGSLPILIGAPDEPGTRRAKLTIADVTLNDGLHFHGVLVVPPRSRLTTSVEQHFRDQQRLYVGDRTRLDRLHVVPVDQNLDDVVRYALKGLARGRLPYDSIVVLPRSLSELR